MYIKPVRLLKISVQLRLKIATETDEVNIKLHFLVFKHFSVLTLKLLIVNHKTVNLMLKLKITDAQSMVVMLYIYTLCVGAFLTVNFCTLMKANCSQFYLKNLYEVYKCTVLLAIVFYFT